MQTNFEIPVVGEDQMPDRKVRRSGIMLCYPFDEKRLMKWSVPYIIQPKLNGVRCRAVISNGSVMLLSSEMHIITSIPHINAALLKSFGCIDIEFDGELYLHGMSFQDIFSRTSRTAVKHSRSEDIEYHIFDIVASGNQVERLVTLNGYKNHIKDDCIKIVDMTLAREFDEVMRAFDYYVDSGYEGFIIREPYSYYVRKRSTSIMKFKPHKTDTYLIIGTVEEVSKNGVPKGTLGSFMCTSDEGSVFYVGSGPTQEERIRYWKERETLVGKKLLVKYQTLTPGRRVPFFPVYVSLV